ncbi:MAG: hypothetical protein PUG60_02775 [Lachnospiraceae bacterium]|nr:hypothetical protein [Lachnospiraceae bacterium]MDY4971791.1 hypothetical protein [Lachnospiraceae bacterium]
MKNGCRLSFRKRGVILLLALCLMNSSLVPEMDNEWFQVGTMEVQAAEVYQHFYFQGGLVMLPKTSLSYPWTYMKKGDKLQFAVKSNGTLYVGFTRMSDKKMFGIKRSNNFSTTFIIPSSDYYRVFIINNSTRIVSLRGLAQCVR